MKGWFFRYDFYKALPQEGIIITRYKKKETAKHIITDFLKPYLHACWKSLKQSESYTSELLRKLDIKIKEVHIQEDIEKITPFTKLPPLKLDVVVEMDMKEELEEKITDTIYNLTQIVLELLIQIFLNHIAFVLMKNGLELEGFPQRITLATLKTKGTV